MNFLKLQVANDDGRLDEIREFTTDELFASCKQRRRARQSQQTDVAALEADLLEVATEGDRHWASVRFSGMVREAPRAQAEAFERGVEPGEAAPTARAAGCSPASSRCIERRAVA